MSGMIMDHSDIWNDFGGEDEEGGGNGGEAVVGHFLVDESGQATFGMGEREWWSGVWRYWWSGTLDKGLLAGEGCLNETGSGCGRDLAIIELCLTGPSP